MTNVEDLLRFIPPDEYDTWMKVGAALKHEGYSVGVWDDWSRGSSKYEAGACERKWKSFNESTSSIVTGGTIFRMACEYGYEPTHYDDTPIDLNNLILQPVVDPAFVSAERVAIPTENSYDAVSDLCDYLETLFEPDDIIGYCTSVKKDEKDGRYKPTGGVYCRTRDDILASLRRAEQSVPKDKDKFKRSQEVIGQVFGTLSAEGGAYIRFNPLDGHGEANANVTRRDYCLIESDTLDIDKQMGLLKAMNLPIKLLVNSGNKSLHAIVHVGAINAKQYQDRVRILYDFCKKNGYIPDENDKNESRYSRMPGVKRGSKIQCVVGKDIGAKSYDDWVAWVEEQNDDLPDAETFSEVWKNPKPLAEELIEGVLRVGHKLLLAAPSKAGKSFLLMELVIAIAEGRPWLGMACKKGKVLYVNLELDTASCEHRFIELYKAMNIAPMNLDNIIIWNLRGRAVPMNKLTPSAVRRYKNSNLAAIVIDPIYKVITGDENNATEMSVFCSYFDRLALDCNCSVIYSHHHSKGATSKYANAVDRSSGSGVFARDPDAILDLTQLNPGQRIEDYKKQTGTENEPTAWEMSATLREFKPMPYKRLWFDYPCHKFDEWNFLASAKYYDGGGRGVGKEQETTEDTLESLDSMFIEGFDTAIPLEDTKYTERNVYRKIKGTEFKLITLDGIKCITKEVARVQFQGETYVKEGSGKGAKWVKETRTD